jgi:hypothetical protein
VNSGRSFLNERGQAGQQVGLSNAVMNILVDIHPKLVGGTHQRLKGIPSPDALSGACEASLTSRLRTRCLAPSSAGLLCKRISGWESTISNGSFLAKVRALRSSNWR